MWKLELASKLDAELAELSMLNENAEYKAFCPFKDNNLTLIIDRFVKIVKMRQGLRLSMDGFTAAEFGVEALGSLSFRSKKSGKYYPGRKPSPKDAVAYFNAQLKSMGFPAEITEEDVMSIEKWEVLEKEAQEKIFTPGAVE